MHDLCPPVVLASREVKHFYLQFCLRSYRFIFQLNENKQSPFLPVPATNSAEGLLQENGVLEDGHAQVSGRSLRRAAQ